MRRCSSKHRGREFQTTPGTEAYQQAYGRDALVTRLGDLAIVHLDRPSPETIQRRIDEVIREEIRDEAFEEDCPLCQSMKQFPYDVVYYGEGT